MVPLKYRIKGIAYYSLNDWSKNPWTSPITDGHNGDLFMLYPPSEDNNPIPYESNGHCLVSSVRFELMRDGIEDFEYLFMLNSNKIPEVFLTYAADTQVNKIISGLTSYSRYDEFLYNLRRLIGLKIGGEIQTIPDIKSQAIHPRAQGRPGNYFVNFQDPSREPSANPLVVNGDSYMKIGCNKYNDTLWYGGYGDMANIKYNYLGSGPNVLQRSIIYDDWGRQKTFEFDCPNDKYNVEISVGRHGKGYQHHKIRIEGIDFVNDEATTVANPYIVRNKPAAITDNKLTIEMGIFDEYTMLNYLIIKSADATTSNQKKAHSFNFTTISKNKDHITFNFIGNQP